MECCGVANMMTVDLNCSSINNADADESAAAMMPMIKNVLRRSKMKRSKCVELSVESLEFMRVILGYESAKVFIFSDSIF